MWVALRGGRSPGAHGGNAVGVARNSTKSRDKGGTVLFV